MKMSDKLVQLEVCNMYDDMLETRMLLVWVVFKQTLPRYAES